MFRTKSGRSLIYSASFVEVEPGLTAKILKSSTGKDHPQSDGVDLVIDALHARRNEDRQLRAGNHVSALRSSEVLHRFSKEVAGLDIRNHHTVSVTRHRMLDPFLTRRGLQERAIECERAEDLCVIELTGFDHLGEEPGVDTRGQRLADRFRCAHERNFRARESERAHNLYGVLHDLLLLLQVR